jgi:hypothetical protein
MKHLIIIIALIVVLPQFSKAQTLVDAYRLSNLRINGTARAGAMGNAFGALGGDFTSLSINPAGVGIYRTNEFVFTPVLKSNNSEISLNGTTFSDSKLQISASNIGFVGIIPLNEGNGGAVSFNYGIGYNNVLDFNQNYFGRSYDSQVSYLDDITGYANNERLTNSYLNQNIGNIEFRDWPTKLAWDTYLIDPAKDNSGKEIDQQYVSKLYDNETVNQLKSYSQKGGINEFVFSGGVNINHQLYFGATFGLQNVDLNQITEYSETFGDNSYTMGEDYTLEGTGYNFKFGAIFKPAYNLRLGAAIHTPTYYVLTEKRQLYANSIMVDNNSSDGTNIYDYNFLSPWKAVVSGALVFKKVGLISVDAEYLDYSNMEFKHKSGSNQEFNDLNNDIKNEFDKALNVRVGGELKVSPQFSLRGGYEYYPNAQNQMTGNSIYMQQRSLDKSFVYSVGLGFASNGFYSDISYRNINDKYVLDEIQPNFENHPGENNFKLTNNNNKIMFTLGFRF